MAHKSDTLDERDDPEILAYEEDLSESCRSGTATERHPARLAGRVAFDALDYQLRRLG